MFTGLIEEIGTIRGVQGQSNAISLTIQADYICPDLAVGDSIAINGVCLTVTLIQRPKFSVDAVEETVSRSSLRNLKVGSRVNLERALRLSDRLGGHLVTGHVDATGQVIAVTPKPNSRLITVRLDRKLMSYLIEKGSIAIDGVSLTIAELSDSTFTVSIIPETWKRTTMNEYRPGRLINIEVDLIGKYVERLIKSNGGLSNRLNFSLLEKLGY